MFSTKTIAVAVAAFFAHSALAAADCSRTYTVKPGDVCDQISASQQSSTYQLAVLNQGVIDSTCSNLMPGEQICLASTADEDCTDVYVVKQDDSCDAIASMSNLNSTILRLNNPQINDECDNIYVGEVLCVASTVKVPPAPAGDTPATAIPVTATAAAPSATKAASPPPPKAPAPASTVTTTPAPTKPPPKAATPASTVTATPAPTKPPTPVPTKPAAAAAPAPQQEDGDDEDLPFCDEM